MRYLLIALALLVFPAFALAARFDFTNGQPGVMDDGAVGDTFEQTRYDFTNGQPSPVFDSTATEEAGEPTSYNEGLIVNGGGEIINNGGHIIQ